MTPPTAEERAGYRVYHKPEPGRILPTCESCREMWPCPIFRTLDALEAAEAERERLRVALEGIGTDASESATRMARSGGPDLRGNRFFEAMGSFERIADRAHTALAAAERPEPKEASDE